MPSTSHLALDEFESTLPPTPAPLPHAVLEIGALHFEGNIIPHSWYAHLKTPSGKTYLTAMAILSEIIYWYRPRAVKDEHTGRFLGWSKRFKADKLQRSYESFAQQFGFGKGEVKNAIDYLIQQGLITREFRTLTTTTGLTLSNVMYLEPVAAAIAAISRPTGDMDSIPPDGITAPPQEGGAGGGTYTETTTETTIKILRESAPALASGETPPAQDAPGISPEMPQKDSPPRQHRTGKVKKERTFSPMEYTLAQVCALDPVTMTDKMFYRVRAVGARLEAGHYAPAQVQELFGEGGRWYAVWPGNQEHRPPRPEEVADRISEMIHAGQVHKDVPLKKPSARRLVKVRDLDGTIRTVVVEA